MPEPAPAYSWATSTSGSWVTVSWSGSSTTAAAPELLDWSRLAASTSRVMYVRVGDGPVRAANADVVGPILSEIAAERHAADEEWARRRREEARARRDRIVAARTRARDLLRSLLTDEQRANYDRHDWFVVVGSAGGRYRIHPQVSGGVRLLDGDREVAAYCAHPGDADDLPIADVQLSQMLALQADEPAFLRVANCHWDRRPPVAPAPRRLPRVERELLDQVARAQEAGLPEPRYQVDLDTGFIRVQDPESGEWVDVPTDPAEAEYPGDEVAVVA